MAPLTSRPVVYLGPSLPLEEARAVLPEADYRPPLRRGELYRDRSMGASILLVVDGVFFQDEAIPPREVLDVLADGALVLGASSMGALRAAECWPAGMVGVGLVYRLFRSGRLLSDDEVAVAFDPADGNRPASVALVNVRYAVRQAVRARRLEAAAAERIVRAAQATWFPERRWESILRAAGVPAEALAHLARFDVKAMDATRALRSVGARLAADPGLAARISRASDEPFVPNERIRERPHDPLEGLDPAATRLELARWMAGSGRYARFLPALAAPCSGEVEPRRASIAVDTHVAEAGAPGTGEGRRWLERRAHERPALEAAAGLRLALWRAIPGLLVDEGAFALRLWAVLELAGELDAEVARMMAVADAESLAGALGLVPRALDRHLAESEIAVAHGFPSWSELRRAAGREAPPAALLAEACDRLARAKRVRGRLFEALPPRDVASGSGPIGPPGPPESRSAAP